MPLYLHIMSQPFDQWGLGCIGPISSMARGTHARYIIVVIDHVTKWTKAREVHKHGAYNTSKFFFENIITVFGCPKVIINVQGGNIYESSHS